MEEEIFNFEKCKSVKFLNNSTDNISLSLKKELEKLKNFVKY